MKTIKFKVVITYCLASVFMGQPRADILSPDNERKERDGEKLILEKRYVLPMNAMSDILEDGLRHYNRLPDEKEFRDFILNGPGPGISCSQTINLNPEISLTRDLFFKDGAQNRVDLQDFLKKHKLQVYSDSKTLYVILKQDPKSWTFKNFKPEDYDLLVDCAYRNNQCDLRRLDMQKKSCRNNKNFARNHCYLGDKKVIDYD